MPQLAGALPYCAWKYSRGFCSVAISANLHIRVIQRVAPSTGADAITRPSAPAASARCGSRSVGTMAWITCVGCDAAITLEDDATLACVP